MREPGAKTASPSARAGRAPAVIPAGPIRSRTIAIELTTSTSGCAIALSTTSRRVPNVA